MRGVREGGPLSPALIPATVTFIEVRPHGAPHMDTEMPVTVYNELSVSVYVYDTGDEAA